MKPEIKTQLVAALRSGEYEQTHGSLRRGNCFCFAGVLSDLAVKAGVGEWREAAGTEYAFVDLVEGQAEYAMLHKAVRDWAGLPHTAPGCTLMAPYNLTPKPTALRMDERLLRASFFSLNDYYELTFEQFAELLEKQP